jgi:hypothetical protein
MADYCAVDVVEGGGFARLGFAHADPKREEEVRALLTGFRPEDVSPEHPVMKALMRGISDIITHVTDEGMRSRDPQPGAAQDHAEPESEIDDDRADGCFRENRPEH